MNCPKCKKQLIGPRGPVDAPILLLGEWAGYEEVKTGVCMSGKLQDILIAELAVIGVPFNSCRRMNVWQHAKDEKTCEFDWHVNEMGKEIGNHKYVLVMGTTGTQVLFEKNVMDVSGLRLHSDVYPNIVFVASPSPTLLLHGPVGEFRLALQNFRKEMK